MALEYDGSTRTGIRSDWISSPDGGLTWTEPQTINSTEFNPVSDSDRLTWISPFGNLVLMEGHYVAAFYGGNRDILSGILDQVVMLEYIPAIH